MESEIPHIRRATALQERSGKKKSPCFARNDGAKVLRRGGEAHALQEVREARIGV